MSNPEEKFGCPELACTYVYDPARGDERGKIPAETPFDELPDTWKCPICKAPKSSFGSLSGKGSASGHGFIHARDV
jgi:rubredoxin